MKIDIQRLRNLTTGLIHTKMEHIYEDLELIAGKSGVMTHNLTGLSAACKPWLREHVTDARFWDGKFDTTHTGKIELPDPTAKDLKAMFKRYHKRISL